MAYAHTTDVTRIRRCNEVEDNLWGYFSLTSHGPLAGRKEVASLAWFVTRMLRTGVSSGEVVC